MITFISGRLTLSETEFSEPSATKRRATAILAEVRKHSGPPSDFELTKQAERKAQSSGRLAPPH